MSVKIFVVEDHPAMREMIEVYLDAQPDFTVSGVAATGEEALEGLHALDAEIILIDVSLPGISGLELLTRVLTERPGMRCVMHSGHGEVGHVDQAMAAGALGYVLKGKPSELPVAVRSALRHETYLSESLKKRMESR